MRFSDQEDWRSFRRGDTSGIERIYRRHKDSMYTYCHYVSGNAQLSQDVVQEAFLRLIRQKESLQVRTELKNWLFVCVRNLLLNELKQSKRHVTSQSEYTPLQTESNMETKLFIENVLGQLEPEERELMILREQQGFSIREIAGMLDISEEATRVRLFRVRKKMQQLVRQE